MSPSHEEFLSEVAKSSYSDDLSPTEQEVLEKLVGKARRGEPLTDSEKDALRSIVERHYPKAKSWSWRNVAKAAVALAAGAGAGLTLGAILGELLRESN